MKAIKDGYVLSTGRKFYANRGLIGLGARSEPRVVGEGYDGEIVIDGHWDRSDAWTQAEREELADYMIELWQQWKHFGVLVGSEATRPG